ncbi:MAG: alpha/beta fold hydrolase [Jatrophihabitans sp.]|uniref:alpha/beta fold hydrolase n=1 Tax=Jatrophihabitans sp. TaxID=1932789 RepID=UPI003F7E24DB
MQQRLGLTRLDDGTTVRFAVSGTGPVAILVPGWVSHLELGWALPAERAFAEALSAGRTLVRYDRPGCGLSDPTDRSDTVAVELEVIRAVAAAARADRFDLIGTSFGAPLAVAWAAQHPHTVSRLVLYGGWVEGDRLGTPAVREHILGLVRDHWGLGSDVLTDIFAPDADAGFRALFARYQRESAPATTARRLLAECYAVDIADLLGAVAAPTAVLHRRDDRAVPLAEGERLAAGIAGATLTVLPGRSHLPFVGDTAVVLREVRRGLGLPPLEPDRSATLTHRQLEVAALVAEGWSNRQIAEHLVLSERSVESHVERIRTRLDLRSRAQLAAWFVATHPPAREPS